MQAFAGLRAGEVCNVRQDSLAFTRIEKVYIAFNLGELSPYTLQDIVRELGRFSCDDILETKYPNHIFAFLQLLPGGSAERDLMLELLSDIKLNAWGSGNKNRQRVLADFQSCKHCVLILPKSGII